MNFLKNNISKMLITTIFLFLFLITISSVNAAEHNITNTTDGGLNRSIFDANNGDIINLDNGVYSNNVTNITINKNLTIQGKNQANTVIDAQKVGRIFNVTAGNTLTLINITFINGNSTDGGVIYTTGMVNLINCTFSNNIASNLGGVIYNIGPNMDIINCTFTNNTSPYGAGVIFTTGDIVNIKNSNFIDNSAIYNNGGAIYNVKGTSNINPKLTIIGCKFINIRAGSWGGAIYNYQSNDIIIDNSDFINASCGLWGGAIYNYECSNVIVNNSNFSTCNAIHGGAIFNHFRVFNMSILNSNFINNTASNSGGAIVNSESELTITNSNFTSNKATQYGGGIFTQIGTLVVNNSNFINNSANTSGGGITFNGDNSVNNCTFRNNNATNGGAIFNDEDSNLNINNSIFTNNIANNNGGGIYNTGEINILNSNLTNNKGSSVIFINDNNTLIKSCNIFNNSHGILINSTATNNNINYNRIFNNTDYDLNNAGINTNADYNWWGNNTPTKIVGITPNNYFVMNVTNLTSLDSNGTVTFNYTFKLNNSEDADNSLLPYFVTNVFTNVTTGIIDSFDARFDRTFNVTVTSSGNILYTFINDNEIQTLKGTATIPEPKPEPTPTNADVNNPKGKNGETVNLIAKLTDKNGNPIAGKLITFYVAGMILTAITDADGIATVQYTINEDDFTDGKLAFIAIFEGDDNYIASTTTGTVTLIEKPIPPEPTPTPTPMPTPEPDNNQTNNNPTAKAVMKETGIPIIVILIVLLSSLGLVYRKK